ncbi:hypothetical protein HN954_00145 [bacterium]|jgi:DNA polymerase III delta prime subunit|nr:hypothetical protein [bacterium]MBT6832046.1 hypothetical protein [bacterium]MBT6995827.1 hypothetical protein [bacterium]MBT7772362.1 hypothetical protein [bacterium]
MQILAKIQKWLDADIFPQRVLLSGNAGALDLAIEIAAQLQKFDRKKIAAGVHADTIVFRDSGKSFKIDFSDRTKKDEQGEFENVLGMIRWAHGKPESAHRIVIFENLERVTFFAPHAMLKLIEEPPARAQFIFTTRNHHKMLDTILSRVTTVRLPQPERKILENPDIETFLNGKNLLEKFQLIKNLDEKSRDNPEKKIDRTELLKFLEDAIHFSRGKKSLQKNLNTLLETHTAIGMNLNPKFCLERLALKLSDRD